jgi:hypothetical protein
LTAPLGTTGLRCVAKRMLARVPVPPIAVSVGRMGNAVSVILVTSLTLRECV